jgi:hypothetical protein
MPPRLPFMSYQAVSLSADRWLGQYHPSRRGPVPIEDIVELELGIDIVPVPSLEQAYEVVGILGGDLKTIHIDQRVYEKQEARTRFTLAHELAHLNLHAEILQEQSALWLGGPSNDVEDWLRMLYRIDEREYDWMETHANWWAGCVLVPIGHLEEALRDASQDALVRWERANTGVPLSDAGLADAVSPTLAAIFQVSPESIRVRLRKEGLLDLG